MSLGAYAPYQTQFPFLCNNSFSRNKKEGLTIEKIIKQIYDRIFKRIFSLSNVAIINLINGLFHTDFPLDSTVSYPNKEFVNQTLKDCFADVIVIINGTHTFHLEAQMTKDERIVLRVFEYEFFYAVSQWGETNTLEFPEPMVIYLDNQPGIPEESILHISFGSQGTFDYKIQNYMYLEHDVAELNRRKMIVLIPFQLLKLRRLIHQIIPSGKNEIISLSTEDITKINRLQEELRNDIIGSIEANVQFGNITMDDAKQLLELTELLYAHILEECVYLKQIYAEPHKSYDYVNLTKASPISEADFHGLAVCICEALNRYTDLEKAGGCEDMKPLLDGAIELPNDKYRFRIDELEKQLAEYADEISKYADENARYADENARYADENARYADENTKLRERIRELESQK